MAITENHQLESLSRAYLAAVCAKAGLILKTGNFDYGIDVDIAEVISRPKNAGSGNRFFEGNQIRFQLKCTKNYIEENDMIYYDLDSENYNDLCEPANPSKLLGLFVLDGDFNSSIVYSENELILKRCLYWFSLLNAEKTANKSSVRIAIPKQNLICPTSINSLFQLLKEGQI